MKKKSFLKNPYFYLSISLLYLIIVIIFGFFNIKISSTKTIQNIVKDLFVPPKYPPLNKADYDLRMDKLAHLLPADATNTLSIIPVVSTSTATSTIIATSTRLWPVQTPYPLDGAILPFKRIVAYYGNFLSKGMGVLGQYRKIKYFPCYKQKLINGIQRIRTRQFCRQSNISLWLPKDILEQMANIAHECQTARYKKRLIWQRK